LACRRTASVVVEKLIVAAKSIDRPRTARSETRDLLLGQQPPALGLSPAGLPGCKKCGVSRVIWYCWVDSNPDLLIHIQLLLATPTPSKKARAEFD
jgi:hypothetical protein